MTEKEMTSFQDIIIEPDLLNLLELKKSQLDYMRQEKKLPFCKLTNNNRVYIVADVLNWMVGQRVVLNSAE